MVFAMRRKVVLVCLLLAVVQRTVGQSLIIGNDLPCEQPGEDPDPNNDRDNLSCPRLDGVLQCYSRDMLCDGVQFCQGGSDEGTNLNALECGKLFFTILLYNSAHSMDTQSSNYVRTLTEIVYPCRLKLAKFGKK